MAAVFGRAYWPYPVRHVPKTVVPETEHAKRRALVHGLRENRAEGAVQRLDRRFAVSYDERKLEYLELGHHRSEAHGRHVAHRKLSAFDHDRQIAGCAA